MSRYRYKKEKKQTGTDIATTNIDPIRTVTIIHTGVTPARDKKKNKLRLLLLISENIIFKLSLSLWN